MVSILWAAVSVVLFGFAFSYQVSSFNTPSRFTRQRADVEQALEMHDLIGQKCQELGLKRPSIAIDRLDDSFFPMVISVSQWERHQISLGPVLLIRIPCTRSTKTRSWTGCTPPISLC